MCYHLLQKRLLFLYTGLGLGLTLVSLLLTSPVEAYSRGGGGQMNVKVFIITMFSREAKPWLDHEQWVLTFKVPGADNEVHCTVDGMCLTITGVDKVNAAASMMAILNDPQFSFQHSFFLTTGTASTAPSRGTLGFAAWANWITDWDQGFHQLPENVAKNPYGYIPPSTTYPDSTAVFHLNESLVKLAYTITTQLSLQDSPAAVANRKRYPGQANLHPYVASCDTMTGDNLWLGKFFSQESVYITDKLTNHAGTNCTYEQEDTAVATVLKRLGHLDHYLNLRVASAFDQPYPSQSEQAFIDARFRADDIAAANLYLVGSTMAHYLMKQ